MITVFWATTRGTPSLVYEPPTWHAGWPLSVLFVQSLPVKPGKFLTSRGAMASSVSVSTLPASFSRVAVILGGSAGLLGVLKTTPKYWAAAPSGIGFQPSGTGMSILGAPGVPWVITVALFFSR